MTNILQQLLRHTTSVKEVKLTSQLMEKLGEQAGQAVKNSKKIRVFIFKYLSAGNLVAGFLICPRIINNKLPCIIYNRGGNRDFGLVKNGRLFLSVGELAKWGYLVVGSQYPGNLLSQGKDEWGGADLESVLDLYSLLKKLSVADQSKIGMFGSSRGGMMTYLSLTRVKWLKAAVTIGGVTNLFRLASFRPRMQRVFKETFGGKKEAKKNRSIVFQTNKIIAKTPILIMHGLADDRVSPEDALELAQKLFKAKKIFKLVMFEKAGHGLAEHQFEWQACARQWFDYYLKKKK